MLQVSTTFSFLIFFFLKTCYNDTSEGVMKKVDLKRKMNVKENSCRFLLIFLGIFYLVMNYFVLDALIVKTGSLQHIYEVDMEVIGIFVGLFFSFLIGLYSFIVQRWRGFKETIQYIFGNTYLITIFFATICSVFVPFLAYAFFCHTFYYTIGTMIMTFCLNALILTLCSPLLNLIVFLFIIVFGNILSYAIYHIYYFVNSYFIRKSKIWKSIKTYLHKNDKRIRKMILYPNKIEFYLRKKEADKVLLFRGHHDLTPIEQDGLSYLLNQSLFKNYQVVSREFKGKFCTVVLECEKGKSLEEEKATLKKATSTHKKQATKKEKR